MSEQDTHLLHPIERLLAPRPSAILIAGPTASGKSGLAMLIARRHGGVVINADSMQVYRDLRVLSARPSEADEDAILHRLYGHVGAEVRYSAGQWLADVAPVLSTAKAEGRLAVVVGGTGLYFAALTEGLASVPPISPEVRARIAAMSAKTDSAELHRILVARDPEGAATVRPSDRGRIVRALEVLEETGKPLSEWRAEAHVEPVLADPVPRVVIAPDRAWLHARISERADAMLAAGALDEVRRLMARGLPGDLPAKKAIGVRQFAHHLAGRCSLEEALAGVKTETRRYARRQETWFRGRMADWLRVSPADWQEVG
ncbi:tRNA (adenosine(37)-N6)-dimethylallyltransferase MiaA [Bauldia sp.]|uniref:tRNA (adenosine(37)-N6)-dimethylallyltransferase MiaA n=1 Tax=Bauldia sp. TaxID=2575872 RepID=UPI003BAA2D30